jgi:hypothetical protein
MRDKLSPLRNFSPKRKEEKSLDFSRVKYSDEKRQSSPKGIPINIWA